MFYGWTIVSAAFVVLFLSYGSTYCFGVFSAALLEEFRWSRTSVSGIFTVFALVYCIFALPAGRLTDRWGPRAVIVAGGALLGLAYASMALVTRLWQPYLFFGVVAGLGMGTAYVPCQTTVVRWFVRRRGVAVGLASAGAAVGVVLMPLFATALVTGFGWRNAYLVLGVLLFVTIIAAAAFMRRDPEALGLFPDGGAGPPSNVTGQDSLPARQAVRTPGFWLIAGTFTATWFTVFIPLVHLVSFMSDLGYPRSVGATALSTLGVGSVIARPLMGAISDRVGRKTVLGAGLVLQSAAFVGFVLFRDLTPLLLCALLFGYSYGCVSTMFPAIVGDFFGRAQVGGLVGLLFAISNLLTGVGPLVTGMMYDATGTYHRAFLLAAVVNLVALGLLSFARPPRGRDTRAPVPRGKGPARSLGG